MVRLFKSGNICTAVTSVIEQARAAADGCPVFVIVPDRFTLQCEKMLAEGAGCLLNVRVLTFSMLYNVIFDEINGAGGTDDFELLDKTKAVLFMWRAAQMCRDELIWFAGSVRHYNFAEKMYNTINQLTSSMADFSALQKNARSDTTRRKMHDIELIWRTYKQLTVRHTDSSGMLGFLIDNLKKSKLIKETRIFMAGFEYLSIQRCAVVSELVRLAGDFTAGARDGSEFWDFLAETCFKMGSQVADCSGGAEAAAVQVVQCEDTYDEAARAANEICRLVSAGARRGDICVVLADFDNTCKIWTEVFSGSGIAVNADIGKCLLDDALALFLRDFITLAEYDKCENLIPVIKNRYSGIETELEFEIENLCLKYNFGARQNKDKLWFYDMLCSLSKAKTVSDICSVLLKLVKRIGEGCAAEQKLVGIFEVCAEVLVGQKISLPEFSGVFCTLANAVKVSGVPVYADRVMLANAKEYEPSFVKHLFVAGAAAGIFPPEQDDTDIITEFDIKNMAIRIEPSASRQNTRARQAAVNILDSASESLFISYSASDINGDESRCSGLAELKIKEKPDAVPCEEFYSKAYARKKVLSAIGSGEAFDKPKFWKGVLDAVDAGGLAVPNLDAQPENICDAEKLFELPSVYVTQIENFYKCPFYHFLHNGLRLKPREQYNLAANVVGDIVHKFTELLLRHVIDGTEFTADRIINEVFLMQEFADFENDSVNKPVIVALRKQLRIIARLLLADIEKSQYKPVSVEEKISMPENGIEIKGKADRVDTAVIGGKQRAVVIDYKTGYVPGFSYTDLYLGIRLQLPLYLDAVSRKFIKASDTPEYGGAFYLPLKGGYGKGEKSIAVNGIVASDDGNIDAVGCTLGSVKKVSQGQFAAIVNYAKKMAVSAAEKIRAGYIKPVPCGRTVCGFCPASAVCMFKDESRGIGLKVNINTFSAGTEGDNCDVDA